jgi:hypothetical protein
MTRCPEVTSVKKPWLILLLLIVIAAVAWSPVKSYLASLTSTIEGQIEDISDSSLAVDCSDEANRGIRGDINDIGYICSVEITKDTILRAANGEMRTLGEVERGDTAIVRLTKRVSIRRIVIDGKAGALVAKEIVLRDHE